MRKFEKSVKLNNVCYDIRGPVMDEANRMSAAGEKILKLNIGNPAPFGFEAPDEVSCDRFYVLTVVSLLLNVFHRQNGYGCKDRSACISCLYPTAVCCKHDHITIMQFQVIIIISCADDSLRAVVILIMIIL